jgi:hypothetical protein
MGVVLEGIERALGSDWLLPVLIGVLVSTGRIDWLTGIVACIAYVNLRERTQ